MFANLSAKIFSPRRLWGSPREKFRMKRISSLLNKKSVGLLKMLLGL
jgi:hypothetical protein